MSLTTAGIHCTISQRLSGAMEDCSIVRVQQPRTLCRQRCCMTASQRMFGSLCIWSARLMNVASAVVVMFWFRFIIVLMQSLSGSGHNFACKRLRLGDKLEMLRFDPWGSLSLCLFSVYCCCCYVNFVGVPRRQSHRRSGLATLPSWELSPSHPILV